MSGHNLEELVRSSRSIDASRRGHSRGGRGGDAEVDQLFEILYQDLRRLARKQLRGASRRGSLSTTALVHETFLRLQAKQLPLADQQHFRAVCARAMRFVLMDCAKARTRLKRGGQLEDLPFEEAQFLEDARFLDDEKAEQLLALDAALNELVQVDERVARVVEYRFFAGMTNEEVAVALEVSSMTVKRDWQKAKAFLANELGSL